jgi:hypothetical protein
VEKIVSYSSPASARNQKYKWLEKVRKQLTSSFITKLGLDYRIERIYLKGASFFIRCTPVAQIKNEHI